SLRKKIEQRYDEFSVLTQRLYNRRQYVIAVQRNNIDEFTNTILNSYRSFGKWGTDIPVK
uniref:Uncharacterized protein n=1 Tax=Oryza brachyantha TaxID=4533 RepID=J3L226_ORYBR